MSDNSDTKMWSVLCHASALSGFIIPFGNLLGPLLIWLIKREEMPEVDAHGKESLNFQITLTIAMLVAAVLIVLFIGLLLLPLIAIYGLVMVIIASIKASEGNAYSYPFTLRLIK